MAETLITDRASLKTVIADELNRTDLSDQIGNFIQNAESRLKDDERVRQLAYTSVTIDENPETSGGSGLPTDLDTVESWYHDGSTYFGEIEIVSAGELGLLKSRFGATGVPMFAALVEGSAYFAPAPDGSYVTKMTYWKTLPSLSSTDPNWLLTDRPDIYLYACLVESAPFLREDERIPTWERQLEQRIEQMHIHNQRRQFGGSPIRRVQPIG